MTDSFTSPQQKQTYMELTGDTQFYPSAYQQRRIRLLEALTDQKLYNKLTVAVEGPLDSGILCQAIHQTLERHEIFRVRLRSLPDLKYPVQVMADDPDVQVVQTRLSGNTDPLTYLSKATGATIEVLKAHNAPHYLHFSLPAEQGDAYTLYSLFQAIVAEYQALDQGYPLPAQDDALQYVDFSEWQRELMDENQGENAVSYWENLFDAQETEENVVFEVPKQDQGNFDFQVFNQKLKPSLVKNLTEAIASHDLSLAAALFFGWYHTIERYTKKPTVGMVTHERVDPQLKDIAGPIARTLPIKPTYSPNDEMVEALQHVDRLLAGASEFQYYFEGLIQQSEVKFLPYGFKYDVIPEPIEQNELKWRIISQYSVVDVFKLLLTCHQEGPGEVTLSIRYDQNCFDLHTVQHMMTAFTDILESVSEGVDRPVASIGIGEGETGVLLQEFNRRKTTPSPQTNFVRLFQDQAIKTPDRLAIRCGDNTWTYQELDIVTNTFAHLLKTNYRITPGDSVAVCAKRSDRLIIALIGIMKAGAAFIPLDSHWPEERVKFILQDCDASLLLTDNQEVAVPIEKASLATCFALLSEGGPPDKVNIASECAYYIYTSGTTGKPKGVGISHGALANYLQWFSTTYDIGPEDSTVLFSSVAFDLSYTALWSSLVSGAALHVLEESKFLDVQALSTLLSQERISYIKLTPSHFRMLVDDISFEENIKNYALKLIVLGGEEIIPEDIDTYFGHDPDVTFVNHYGPTEATIGTIAYTITLATWPTFKRCPVIGTPIANSEVYVLDKNELTPIGVPGEICVAGPGLAIGYHKNDALNAEKFVEVSFGGISRRLYRTGDVGRWLPTGSIEFRGRKDFQVKVRGYRIELAEIEHTLLAYEGVSQALVTAVGEGDEKRILAYAVPVGSPELPHQREIKKHLARYLPDYMVPAEIIVLDSFPLAAHGKIDRKALPTVVVPSGKGNEIARPLSRTETRLAKIWQEALGRSDIAVSDNFFEVGGHSLKATQIISRIAKELNVRINLKQLFNHPTIESLAKTLEASSPEGYKTINQAPDQDYYPVSHAQRRLWIIDQMEKGNVSYNIPKAYAFHGHLDVPLLRKVLKVIVGRHESLRTTFINVNGEPKQRICSPEEADSQLSFIDLRAAASKEEQAIKIVKEEACKAFDLEKGPLIRFKLIGLEPDHYIFVFTVHHIVSDAISKEILIDECATLYDAFCRGEANPLPVLKIQYRDYATWESEQLSGENYETHRSFWMDKLAGSLPVVRLPIDRERSPIRSSSGRTVSFALENALSTELSCFCQKREATLFMTLLTALNVLLFRYSGQEDIIVGTPVSGRNHHDLESQMGLYLNSLPLRTQFKGEWSFEQLLSQVKTATLDAFTHQIYPFDALVEDLGVPRDRSRSPLFDVVLVLGNIEKSVHREHRRQLPGLSVNNVDTGFRASNVDLRFVFFEKEDKVLAHLDYNPDLFADHTIKVMVQRLKEILSTMVSFPEKAISLDKPSISPGEETAIRIEEAFSFDF